MYGSDRCTYYCLLSFGYTLVLVAQLLSKHAWRNKILSAAWLLAFIVLNDSILLQIFDKP
jgi:hypothetical protein